MGERRPSTTIGVETPPEEGNEMSDTMREVLPVVFMFGCVLALGPFIAFAMWLAFDGDRLREDEVPTVEPSPARQKSRMSSSPPSQRLRTSSSAMKS
jgi:hypothetical protein